MQPMDEFKKMVILGGRRKAIERNWESRENSVSRIWRPWDTRAAGPARLILLSILLIAGFLRFFNLMHDSPYFFNPDERNMASAITRFRLPVNPVKIPICLLTQFFPHQLDAKRYTLDANSCTLNPHFFAYGQFPMYLAFTSDLITRAPLARLQGVPLQILSTDFPAAIF